LAATFAPSTASLYASRMVKRMPLTDPTVGVQIDVLQSASSMIWMAAPWRWTIGVFPITSAVAAGASTVSLSGSVTDFLLLEKVNLNNDTQLQELTIVNILPASPTQVQMPNFCAYVASGPLLQFESKMPTDIDDYKAYVWYKKQAPVITTSNYATAGTLVMDDDYFWIYEECVLYWAYKFADDPRAGGAQVEMTPNGPKVTYSGQRAVAEAGISYMRERESLVSMYPKLNPNPLQQKGLQG